jgi:hypothetical protein
MSDWICSQGEPPKKTQIKTSKTNAEMFTFSLKIFFKKSEALCLLTPTSG